MSESKVPHSQPLENSFDRIRRETIRKTFASSKWDCVCTSESYGPVYIEEQNAWCDFAKEGNWEGLLDIATKGEHFNTEYVNAIKFQEPDDATSPDGYTALHHVALKGAPLEVAEALVGMGAFRCVQTTDGKNQRPIDIAQERGHTHLYDILTPQDSLPWISGTKMSEIETNVIEKVIKVVAKDTIEAQKLRFPQIEVMRELQTGAELAIQIPGLYYSSWILKFEGGVLISKCWQRNGKGSTKLYQVTPQDVSKKWFA